MFLNMAQNALSCWKQAIKRSLASRKDEFICPRGAILNSRTLHQFKFDTINDTGSSTAVEVTISKCQSLYNHTATYLPACIGRKEIDG